MLNEVLSPIIGQGPALALKYMALIVLLVLYAKRKGGTAFTSEDWGTVVATVVLLLAGSLGLAVAFSGLMVTLLCARGAWRKMTASTRVLTVIGTPVALLVAMALLKAPAIGYLDLLLAGTVGAVALGMANVPIYAYLGAVGVLTVYPFLYTLTMSLSSQVEASRDGLHIVPGILRMTAAGGQEDEFDAKSHERDRDAFAAARTAWDAAKAEGKALTPAPVWREPGHWHVGGRTIHYHPDAVSLTSYNMVFQNPNIWIGYRNTLFRTLVGTFLAVLMTCLAAYPLARKQMPFRKQIVFFVLFTMLFSGGLIPYFLLLKQLHLIDSIWVLVVPFLLSAFNVLVVKNFFQSIPDSYAESAQLDGANDWHILFRIYMPLSTPVLATITLWTAVTHWNEWFLPMIAIGDNSKQVLQTFLQRIVIEGSTDLIEKGLQNPDLTQFTSETIKAATVIVTILPILIFYPFVQKYFVKGIMLGGIKE